jgi:transcriptional regulator
MYVPITFAEERLDRLHEFIATHDFATLITNAGGEMVASHLPMLLLPARGRFGTLQTHLARQNEQWRALAAGEGAMVIFQGPHGYVSPRWYKNPVSVPTWNYVVVHAHGTPRQMEEAALREHLHALVRKYEPRDGGWDPAAALPGEVMEKLQQQIVGFDIEITAIEGKWKLGQNRTREDREGAIDGLRQTGETEAIALAGWMAATLRM